MSAPAASAANRPCPDVCLQPVQIGRGAAAPLQFPIAAAWHQRRSRRQSIWAFGRIGVPYRWRPFLLSRPDALAVDALLLLSHSNGSPIGGGWSRAAASKCSNRHFSSVLRRSYCSPSAWPLVRGLAGAEPFAECSAPAGAIWKAVSSRWQRRAISRARFSPNGLLSSQRCDDVPFV